MEHSTADETSRSSRDNSIKDLRTSQSSLKSTKSIDKSSTSGSFKEKNAIQFKAEVIEHELDNQKLPSDASLKVPHKIIANWRSACDKTRDKTKDLLKRWRTLPEIEAENLKQNGHTLEKTDSQQEKCSWSVHVWTTWVDRFSVDSGEGTSEICSYQLSLTQITKFSHFFSCLLDHDQDNLISEQDFESLIERFRHFADWSINSPEYHILREIERGFKETFLTDISNDRMGFTLNDVSYLTKEGFLHKWSELMVGSKNLSDFPIWLQVFVKLLFQVINKSGSGIITRHELCSFYSSALGLNSIKVGEIIDLAYQAMTSVSNKNSNIWLM
ncbi:unnamed protein product [Acanthoscelides obtectus]|uniref:Uncharacterized protein n=1 Tax=Acanthoscelides obtectus TaxID=200917 RepID=A0A9P0LLJ5_ACAOB|nr:unnamed protein product [Acanthoscelides obtectus]CAK1627558.1 hypothetical protein AOBTE_LOCUS4660 [Acanthoscelides obtectus]